MKLEIPNINAEDVEIISIGIRCKSCKKTWGIRLDRIEDLSEIRKERFICMDCFAKKTNIPEIKTD